MVTEEWITVLSAVEDRIVLSPARSEKYGEYQVLSITVSSVPAAVSNFVMLPSESILHRSPLYVT